ncbi:MAG: thioredoxin family protein [Candidatus Eisenbacteria bacterium]
MDGSDFRMIAVAGMKVGMLGLDAVFAELKSAGGEPSEELGLELVALAGKRNYIAPSVEVAYAKALLVEYRRFLGENVPDDCSTPSVQVLGQGCPRCEALMSNVMSALAELGLAAEVEHVRDVKRIAEYGPVAVPVLVVNGKVVVAGKILTKKQIEKLLEKL